MTRAASTMCFTPRVVWRALWLTSPSTGVEQEAPLRAAAGPAG
jgi:hypothetical protein